MLSREQGFSSVSEAVGADHRDTNRTTRIQSHQRDSTATDSERSALASTSTC